MFETVGVEFAVGKGITDLLALFEEKGEREYKHDHSAVHSNFNVIPAHILTDSKPFVCFVVIAMVMLK